MILQKRMQRGKRASCSSNGSLCYHPFRSHLCLLTRPIARDGASSQYCTSLDSWYRVPDLQSDTAASMQLLRALRQQQVLTKCISLPALPTSLACISTCSSSLQQHQNPQLMRVQQQQSSQSSQDQHTSSLWKYLGAGGAAVAAGCAAWSYSNSSNGVVSQIDPMQLSRASPRGQAAVAAACAGPLLHLQHAANPTPAQLQGIAAALADDVAAIGPELSTGLWGLAMFGADLPPQQLDRLAGAAMQQMETLPVYEAIVTGMCVEGGSAGDGTVRCMCVCVGGGEGGGGRAGDSAVCVCVEHCLHAERITCIMYGSVASCVGCIDCSMCLRPLLPSSSPAPTPSFQTV